MKINIYIGDGRIVRTRVEIEEHEDEEKIMENAAGNLLNQIKETGFACIPKGGGYRMINGYEIEEIEILPDDE